MGWSVLKLPFQICFETNNCKQKQYSTNFIGLASLIHRISIAQTSRASQSHLPAFATWCQSLDSFETFETCNTFCKSSLFFLTFFRSASRTRTFENCLQNVFQIGWFGSATPGYIWLPWRCPGAAMTMSCLRLGGRLSRTEFFCFSPFFNFVS